VLSRERFIVRGIEGEIQEHNGKAN
jgi:hypothetical protein